MSSKMGAGMVNCLGWCNKQFVSKDGSRYCAKCALKKEDIEKNMSAIRNYHVASNGEIRSVTN